MDSKQDLAARERSANQRAIIIALLVGVLALLVSLVVLASVNHMALQKLVKAQYGEEVGAGRVSIGDSRAGVLTDCGIPQTDTAEALSDGKPDPEVFGYSDGAKVWFDGSGNVYQIQPGNGKTVAGFTVRASKDNTFVQVQSNGNTYLQSIPSTSTVTIEGTSDGPLIHSSGSTWVTGDATNGGK